jgi:hypothetical protein
MSLFPILTGRDRRDAAAGELHQLGYPRGGDRQGRCGVARAIESMAVMAVVTETM